MAQLARPRGLGTNAVTNGLLAHVVKLQKAMYLQLWTTYIVRAFHCETSELEEQPSNGQWARAIFAGTPSCW